MRRIRLLLLFLLVPSFWLQAKPLEFDKEYQVFGGQPVNLNINETGEYFLHLQYKHQLRVP